jgi:hypothetical protein
MYVYFSSGGREARKVPYWGTGRAELVSSAKIYVKLSQITEQTTIQHIIGSKARPGEPVTRQRDDQVRLS